jgi:glyoxylase I family protein
MKKQDESTTILSLHGVRYQVRDVARVVAFYTDHLGFRLEHQQLPAFASVLLGDFRLLLSGPGASGSRPLPGGKSQQPGGWNRVVLHVADLPARIDALKNGAVKFRNQMEAGRWTTDPDRRSRRQSNRIV